MARVAEAAFFKTVLFLRCAYPVDALFGTLWEKSLESRVTVAIAASEQAFLKGSSLFYSNRVESEEEPPSLSWYQKPFVIVALRGAILAGVSAAHWSAAQRPFGEKILSSIGALVAFGFSFPEEKGITPSKPVVTVAPFSPIGAAILSGGAIYSLLITRESRAFGTHFLFGMAGVAALALSFLKNETAQLSTSPKKKGPTLLNRGASWCLAHKKALSLTAATAILYQWGKPMLQIGKELMASVTLTRCIRAVPPGKVGGQQLCFAQFLDQIQ